MASRAAIAGRLATVGLVGVALAVAAAACSPTAIPPSGLPIGPASPPSPPAFSFSPAPAIPVRPGLSSSPSARFADDTAVDCAGFPPVAPVVALLRSKGIVGRSTSVTARVGPLCAGSWQYTVVVTGAQEELQVVTTGPPSRLRLITAGTYVCTPEVLTQAPAGILTVAQC